MKQRIITGAIFACLFIPGVILGGFYFYALGLIVTYVCTFELLNMFYKKNEGLKIMRFIVPVFSSLFFTLMYYEIKQDPSFFMIIDGKLKLVSLTSIGIAHSFGYIFGILIIALAFIILLFAVISIFMKNPGKSAINMIFSFIYGGLMLSMAFSVENMNISHTIRFEFPGVIFGYVYLIVVLTDVFAYFFGSKFGKHKLCPTISPKKSVEGAIFGSIGSSLIGTLYVYIFNLIDVDYSRGALHIIIVYVIIFAISLLVSIISQFGDLFASTLKREYEIKDYGNILPGHGGLLDRFDSTALAGSVFFVVIMILKLLLLFA